MNFRMMLSSHYLYSRHTKELLYFRPFMAKQKLYTGNIKYLDAFMQDLLVHILPCLYISLNFNCIFCHFSFTLFGTFVLLSIIWWTIWIHAELDTAERPYPPYIIKLNKSRSQRSIVEKKNHSVLYCLDKNIFTHL